MKKVCFVFLMIISAVFLTGCSKKVNAEEFLPVYVFEKDSEGKMTHNLEDETLLFARTYVLYSFLNNEYKKEGIIEILYAKVFYDDNNEPYYLYKVKINNKILEKYKNSNNQMILGIVV